jgi:hypothetical protein
MTYHTPAGKVELRLTVEDALKIGNAANLIRMKRSLTGSGQSMQVETSAGKVEITE